MMRNLTNSIADLISGLQGVTVLFDMFGGGFNVEELMKNADAIDSLLQSLSLQRIVNRWGYPVNICTFVDLRGGVGRIIPLKKHEHMSWQLLQYKTGISGHVLSPLTNHKKEMGQADFSILTRKEREPSMLSLMSGIVLFVRSTAVLCFLY